MTESLTDKLTRHGMAAASSHVYGGEAELLFAARDRIADLEAHVRRSIACIESMQPYVMWDGEDEQAKVETTLTLLRGALECRA